MLRNEENASRRLEYLIYLIKVIDAGADERRHRTAISFTILCPCQQCPGYNIKPYHHEGRFLALNDVSLYLFALLVCPFRRGS